MNRSLTTSIWNVVSLLIVFHIPMQARHILEKKAVCLCLLPKQAQFLVATSLCTLVSSVLLHTLPFLLLQVPNNFKHSCIHNAVRTFKDPFFDLNDSNAASYSLSAAPLKSRPWEMQFLKIKLLKRFASREHSM